MKVRIASSFALAGAFFGLFVLAPLAMILAHLVHGAPLTIDMPLRGIYTVELLKWTIPFTFLGGVVGSLFGLGVAGLRDRTALIEQARRYTETLFDSVGEGLLSIDGSYRIKKANRAFLAQSGFSDAAEVQGSQCWDILHAGDGPCKDVEYCAVKEVFTSASPGSCVHTHFTKDGRETEVEISAYPVRGADGNGDGDVVEAITVIRDLTARRRAEEERKAYTRQIEHSNQLKGLFNDILSHDLLNPAMVTAHMSDMLAARKHDCDSPEIDVIRRNARKLLTLLRDASKYASMESLETLKKERCDIMPLLHEVIDRQRPSFEERGMTIALQGAEPTFACINPLFEEVVQNILTNALKYSPEKTAVTVNVVPVERGIQISVADEGVGVPDKYKRTIFERFDRGGDSGVKGSGLGLAIARRITDLHDGTIWVENGLTGGSIFHVFLPDSKTC